MESSMSWTTTWAFSPACAACGQPGAQLEILSEENDPSASGTEVRLIYSGPGGSNGNGRMISWEHAKLIMDAFAKPIDPRRIRSAGFYDEAGYCRDCAAFYCETHWHVSSTGGGRCPRNHFKSLDPHSSPD